LFPVRFGQRPQRAVRAALPKSSNNVLQPVAGLQPPGRPGHQFAARRVSPRHCGSL